MEYKIVFKSEKIIRKDFQKIPINSRKLIFKKLEELKIKGVDIAQIKKLNNYYLCDYRLRVGTYRILFNLQGDKIIVFRILHRSKLY